MRVKILEDKIRHAIDGVPHEFLKDEVRVVPDADGAYFCALGWAEDVDGVVKTGERVVNKVQTLTVDSVRQATTAEVPDNG